jgi:ATP-dependent DNA helicase RecG
LKKSSDFQAENTPLPTSSFKSTSPHWVTIEDLDQEEIQTTLQNAIKLGRMKQPSHTDAEFILRGLSLFDDGRLINAAVALYGKSERLFANYPQLTLRLARFRGSDRLTGFMDNRDYWGNAFDLLRRGELFLLDHVPIAGRVVPGKIIREDYPLYPLLQHEKPSLMPSAIETT